MHALFRGISVIPVLTIEREGDAVPLARALGEGGLAVIEVTLRTPAAIAAIAAIAARAAADRCRRRRPCSAPPMSPRRRTPARAFWSAPDTTPELAASALASELPYLPGVATPSEVMAARSLGICVMKLFPAEALGGIGFLQALAPVFPGHCLLSDRRHRRALGGRLLGAAERADGRRLMDGAARTRSQPAIGRASAASPSAPPRSARPGRPDRAAPAGSSGRNAVRSKRRASAANAPAPDGFRGDSRPIPERRRVPDRQRAPERAGRRGPMPRWRRARGLRSKPKSLVAFSFVQPCGERYDPGAEAVPA